MGDVVDEEVAEAAEKGDDGEIEPSVQDNVENVPEAPAAGAEENADQILEGTEEGKGGDTEGAKPEAEPAAEEEKKVEEKSPGEGEEGQDKGDTKVKEKKGKGGKKGGKKGKGGKKKEQEVDQEEGPTEAQEMVMKMQAEMGIEMPPEVKPEEEAPKEEEEGTKKKGKKGKKGKKAAKTSAAEEQEGAAQTEEGVEVTTDGAEVAKDDGKKEKGGKKKGKKKGGKAGPEAEAETAAEAKGGTAEVGDDATKVKDEEELQEKLVAVGKGKKKRKKSKRSTSGGDTVASSKTSVIFETHQEFSRSDQKIVDPSISGYDPDAAISSELHPITSSRGGGLSVKSSGRLKAKRRKSSRKKSSLIMEQASTESELGSGEWSWESVSVETVELEEVKPSEPERRRSKDQKTKKPKQKKEKVAKDDGDERKAAKEAETAADSTDDIMAEIAQLRAVAATAAEGEGEGEKDEGKAKSVKSSKQGKGKKKKKLTKEEKAQLAAELAAQAALQAELAAKEAERLAKEKREELKQAAIERQKKLAAEQVVRSEQLRYSVNHIKRILRHNAALAMHAKKLKEWELYLKCDGLPNPTVCPEMTTYLHVWQKQFDKMTMEDAKVRASEVISLLETLKSFTLEFEVDKKERENWRWLTLRFRETLQKCLDVTSYLLLRDIPKNLNRTSIQTADYKCVGEHFVINMWLRVRLPIPLFNPRAPPKPRIELDFNNMNMKVEFPLSVDCEMMAIRAMYLKYDHLGDLSATYKKPETPEDYHWDLFQAAKNEWREQMKYKYENRTIKKKRASKAETEEVIQEVEPNVDEMEEIPEVPYKKLDPSASVYVLANEERKYAEMRQRMMLSVDDDVVSLRKYIILGGLYYLNLLFQPSQPFDMVLYKITISNLQIPDRLEEVPFCEHYSPPPPPEPGVTRSPEEIEHELKKQEEEMEKLIMITLNMPDHVMFMELPSVCRWDKVRKNWTTTQVFDVKHNEEKGYLTFKTGVFGCFGLYTYKYSNLPYQAWEIKPEVDGSVTLQISAAVVMVDFNVKDDKVCLAQLQGGPNQALQDIVGEYFPISKLTRMMKKGGVHLFPSPDTFCYVEGACEKHWPMESHLYYNMAQLSVSYNFTWSRWNMTAGRRCIVLQMREYRPGQPKQKDYSMLRVTPLNALLIDCTEVSPTFNEEGIEGMKFYADLYHLMKGTSNIATRTKVKRASFELIKTLADLLMATKPLSYS